MDKIINIAIDGPSGAGKSTMAKILAKEMGLVYLDTGAMYRGLAYYVSSKGIAVDDVPAVEAILPSINMDINYKEGVQQVIVCGINVTPYIREHAVSMLASTISKIPAVRIKLVELQRAIAKGTNCVLDGRDIGSYVLPDADYKIFLTADAKERARRRFVDLQLAGSTITEAEVLADVEARDYQDTHREFAPLVAMPDSIIINSTGLEIEQSVALIKNAICK